MGGRTKKQAICHPERDNFSHGLCSKCYQQKYYKKNRQHILAASKRYYKNNKKHVLKRIKLWRLKYVYGLTLQGYKDLVKAYKGKCAICNRKYKKLYIDHSHITGKTRGMLCNLCNGQLGWYEKRRAIIEEYVDDIQN